MSAIEAEKLAAQAQFQLQSGDRIAALDLIRGALAMDQNCFAAHNLLAGIALSGEDYRILLHRIHGHYRPRTYLEIGVFEGGTITFAGEGTLAIGVDPAPRTENDFPSNIRIFRETSDEFFASHDLNVEFGGNPIDFAFIDGMHLFEYILRDFINVERNSVPGTRVLVHDCYPLDEATSSREQRTRFWTGDGWKFVVCLKKYRPDLRVHTLAAYPSGLVVVRGLDRHSTVLSGQLDAICREFISLPFAAIQTDKPASLNLVPGDWATTRKLLD
jgi:Methyltransferase domain